MRKIVKDLVQWDRQYLWHPFTQQAEWEKTEPIVVASARGAKFKDIKGREYIDGVASLWVNAHGHRHPVLDMALKRQLGKMAHTTFLGLTHEPAARLGKALVEKAPKGLARVFFSDNGATAVEVALKMAFQYWAQTERVPRKEYLALSGSYHGDTLGAVSVGGIAQFHKTFRPLLFKARFAMSPHCLRCPFRRRPAGPRLRTGDEAPPAAPKPGDFRAETGCRWECLGDVEKNIRKSRGRLAAMIVEPLVQGAAGMQVMPPGYLKGAERLCRKNGLLLIADEVATGFGRTGKMFAVSQEGVFPDFLCLAKSITGGYLPLAATLTTAKVYRAFLGRQEDLKAFYHGHSYTANPLACAVALANLGLFDGRKFWKDLAERRRRLTEYLREASGWPMVAHVRQMGLMAGIELSGGRRPAYRVARAALKHGVWTRPLGATLVILPPLSISKMDFEKLLGGLRVSILEVAREMGL